MEKKIKIGEKSQPLTLLPLTLLCHNDGSEHQFCAPSQQTVAEFLEQAIERLSHCIAPEAVTHLRQNYIPVLERLEHGNTVPLESTLSLQEAGVSANDTLQIAALPRKEKILFCRYCN